MNASQLLSEFDVRIRDTSFAEIPLYGYFKLRRDGPILQKIARSNCRFNAVALNARSDVCGDFTGWHEIGWETRVTVFE